MAGAAQVKIFFGSQSGTAESFSEELRDEAVQQGIDAEVVDMIGFTPESFAAVKIAVLVVSTYGEGEPTDNAAQFHKWAMDPRNDGALKGQRFTVMGLGDMNYSRFNNMGMECDQFLERLGGLRFYPRGIGDDSQDIADDFQKWKNGGLWAALKRTVAEVLQEVASGGGGYPVGPTATAVQAPVAPPKFQVTVFFGHDAEADGAAKDVCEAVVELLKKEDLCVAGVHSLSDRKSIEVVRKLPKQSLSLLIVDCGPDGPCAAGRKLARNMNLEFDSHALADKDLRYACLTVASSKCNNSAASMKDQIRQAAESVPKALDRAGLKPIEDRKRVYLDAGVEDVSAAAAELCGVVACCAAAAVPPKAAVAAGGAAPPGAPKALILTAGGGEAKEAGEALAAAWPGGAGVEDASLASLAAAAKGRAQVVLAVECAASGDLSDEARGLLVQLNAAPVVVKQQLRQLGFAALAIAATDYGNAGERASARGAVAELTQQAAPVVDALTRLGSTCVAATSADLQDSDAAAMATICGTFQKAFAAKAAGAGAAVNGAPAGPGGGAAGMGTPVLRMAAATSDLPQEAPGEAADVLSRFYFEAERTKVLRVRELRQSPNVAGGLATAEVEVEAVGALKSYTLGGTLSVLPESDPADVAASLKLMGLAEADLDKSVTFVAAEGPGIKIKKPFPTPCTLREALARYCDLARAPTKKMLSAVQPTLKDPAARDRLGKLLADADAVKALGAAPLCCRMHEFWSMLGIASIDASEFLLHCPRQKAREFTIASSPKAFPDKIALCVSLTSHEPGALSQLAEQLKAIGCLADGAVPESRPRFFGSCSGFITTRMKPGTTVLAKFRPSAFHLPEKDVPVIMVGAGAGVAPFRGFWEELRRGKQAAPAALFFGCRHPDEDWLFKDEMNAAVKKQAAGCAALQRVQAAGPKKPLTCLFTAFSRPGEGKQKKYVQDHVRENATSVKHWIQNMSGYVFVCGSTAMGNGVLEALSDVLDGGKDAVESLRKEGRIVAEMWG